MDKKTKEKEQPKLREPKAKTNRFGLSIPVIRMPHDDLIKPEFPQLELVEDTQPTQPSIPNQPNVSNPTNLIKPVAPKSDYSKVANSIARSAVPERLFKGMSKGTYDALYLKTRGAINPVRRIRATKSDLLRWCGVSDVTIDKHLKHLKSIGLVRVELIIGSHEGNWYEVFIPEEIHQPNQPNQPNQENQPNVSKKVGGDPPNLVGDVGGGLFLQDKPFTENPKTYLKTNTSDDEAFADFLANFSEVSRELTGKGLKKLDRENWKKLSELMILELRIAARRTNGISSVPAFLTEVLRRKLRDIPTVAKSSKPKADIVGQSEANSYEIKALDEKGREAALVELREFANDDFLEDFKKWYTPEDWGWLIAKIKKAEKNEK